MELSFSLGQAETTADPSDEPSEAGRSAARPRPAVDQKKPPTCSVMSWLPRMEKEAKASPACVWPPRQESRLHARAGRGEPAARHLETAATMYRDMDMLFWLDEVDAESR